ncbi:hypothetical protein [Victivallis vadensis]|uniref:hypothetical protein n=1 Tax=Victivallis vadensis TaxID=172901 RepID=UPI003D081314
MTESHPLQSITHNIIERYLARYESVSVGIYRFHAINGGEFSKYLNSLKITLSRKAFIPTYCWHYDPYGERYILFLFVCNGYGHYDLGKCSAKFLHSFFDPASCVHSDNLFWQIMAQYSTQKPDVRTSWGRNGEKSPFLSLKMVEH